MIQKYKSELMEKRYRFNMGTIMGNLSVETNHNRKYFDMAFLNRNIYILLAVNVHFAWYMFNADIKIG